ncbi:methyltransferase domain-containing protein [Maribacter hydrothermalis]|uniref:Methyltransferase n=1 Tax=Maribacter hydrothermalis TaxID=1836467 RepID=A0A1B7Z868_9FLAO|nr:methyltransferase domain-containing protein [Maribacter hydrothermalis]APQ19077.1 methyltransferase [Maribacter hydrothermalis]OBR38911.1 methyltransferase [Maribacter hydrothermalis]
MVDFTHRSSEIELMDSFSGTTKELEVILQDINRVNKLLGGYSITLRAVFKLITLKDKESYTILDMGCAEGTMLRKLALEGRKRNVKLKLIGVDLNKQSLELARLYSKDYPEITYLEADILKEDFSQWNIDVVMTTLTLHHFTDDGVLKFVHQFNALASLGVVINDLDRSPIAYYLFKAFSLFFIKTEIAKKDGLLSIRRAFKKKDLIYYASKINNATHHIEWKWAFRYLWVLKKK